MKSRIKRNFIYILFASIVMAGFVPLSFAEPVSIPGGPYAPPEQEVVTESIISYPEMVEELFSLQERSKGMMEIVEIGYSYEGRTLYGVVIGEGDTRMWIQGRIHGNEWVGAEVSLDILKTLVAGGKKARDAMEKITFLIIPIYNPDGSERNIRGTLFSSDLNREWSNNEIFAQMAAIWGVPFTPFERMQSPESQAYWYAWADFKPHYVLDFHMQGTYYVDDTNEMTTFSIGVAGQPTFFSLMDPEIFKGSGSMAITAFDVTNVLGYIKPTRYPLAEQGYNRGLAAGVQVAVPGPNDEEPGWSSSACFFENRNIGQKSRGHIIRQNFVGAWAIIDAIVSGEIENVDDFERFWDEDEVPLRGQSIRTSDKFPQKYD